MIMKKQTAYRLTRNDLQKLEGNGKAQKARNVRRMGKVLIGCTVIGTLGVLISLTKPRPVAAPAPAATPAPVAEVAPAPAPIETIGAHQQLEREAEEALERYNDPAHHCSAVLNRCW